MTKSTLFLAGCLAVTAAAPLTASTDTAVVTTALPAIAPRRHLEDARLVLASVSGTSLPVVDRKRWSALETDFAALVASYGDAPADPDGWRLAFSGVERQLAWLSESGGSLLTDVRDPSVDQTPKAGAIDVPTRVALGAFRTDIELFYDTATTSSDGIVAPEPPQDVTLG